MGVTLQETIEQTANRIRAEIMRRREVGDITQVELARRLGVGPVTFSKFMGKKFCFTPDNLDKLSDILGL